MRELKSFLRLNDQGRDLGNLFRIITTEGHVKWACIDHQRENYRQADIQRLKDIVLANGGGFYKDMSFLYVPLASNTQANSFIARWLRHVESESLTSTLIGARQWIG